MRSTTTTMSFVNVPCVENKRIYDTNIYRQHTYTHTKTNYVATKTKIFIVFFERQKIKIYFFKKKLTKIIRLFYFLTQQTAK